MLLKMTFGQTKLTYGFQATFEHNEISFKLYMFSFDVKTFFKICISDPLRVGPRTFERGDIFKIPNPRQLRNGAQV